MSSNVNSGAPLTRTLGFWAIWAVGTGAVVGDGIFLYSSAAIGHAGPAAMLAFLFAGLSQMAIMVSMGEISVGMPSSGGPTLWVEKYLGRFWGMLSGMTFSIGWVVIGGSVSVALGRLFCYWTPGIDLEVGTILWAAIWFTIFTVLNIVGVSWMGQAQLALTGLLIAIMVGFGLGGVMRGLNYDLFTPFAPYGFGGITRAVPIAVYAYMGASCICFTGSECKKPVDLGRALVWSSITFIVVYSVAMLVIIGNIHYSEASYSMSPFVLAAEVVFGPAGGWVLNLAATLAAATCIISGNIYTPSRTLYAMSIKGYLPKFIGSVNKVTKTPINSILIIWAAGMLGIGIAANAGAMDFYEFLSNQAVLAWILSWTLSIIAGMKYRQEMGVDRIRKEVGWKQPMYPVIPIVAILACVYCAYLSFYDIWQVVGVAVWLGLYGLYYLNVNSKIKKGLIDPDINFDQI